MFERTKEIYVYLLKLLCSKEAKIKKAGECKVFMDENQVYYYEND